MVVVGRYVVMAWTGCGMMRREEVLLMVGGMSLGK
jgi:hypothetical protein